jgi:hypothetical protein
MEITLTINDNLFLKASQLTGIIDKTTLIKAGLNALITLENDKQRSKLDKLDTSITSEIENPLQIFHKVMEISKRCAALPTQDSRSFNDILGYNDQGTFL